MDEVYQNVSQRSETASNVKLEIYDSKIFCVGDKVMFKTYRLVKVLIDVKPVFEEPWMSHMTRKHGVKEWWK